MLKSIVVINVTEKNKNVKNAFLSPKLKKTFINVIKKRYLFFYSLLM